MGGDGYVHGRGRCARPFRLPRGHRWAALGPRPDGDTPHHDAARRPRVRHLLQASVRTAASGSRVAQHPRGSGCLPLAAGIVDVMAMGACGQRRCAGPSPSLHLVRNADGRLVRYLRPRQRGSRECHLRGLWRMRRHDPRRAVSGLRPPAQGSPAAPSSRRLGAAGSRDGLSSSVRVQFSVLSPTKPQRR